MKPRMIAFLLVSFFIIQGVVFIRANSQTHDEAVHLAAGYSYLTTRDFRLNPEHPPLMKELAALPILLWYRLPFKPLASEWEGSDQYAISRGFLYGSAVPANQLLALGRISNLALGVLLVASIGWWAYRLWGSGAMLVAIALASFEPNLIAHSSLITTDIGVVLFIFLTCYFLWEYSNSPLWRYLAASGIALGLALASKYSAILLIGILGIAIVAQLLFAGRLALPWRRLLTESKLWRRGLAGGGVFMIVLVFAALIIPAAYFFHGFAPWLDGLHEFLRHSQDGHAAFFLGEHSYDGWWNYFLVAFLIKTPLGSLMLIIASIVFWRRGKALDSRAAIFLLLPVVTVFLATTQAKVDIGLRHILPVYPFLFVLAGRLATIHAGPGRLISLLIGVPLILTAISSLRISPHQLAYFNELVGGPDHGYRYLADSNLDWGQDLIGVKSYMDKEKIPIIYLSYFGTAPPSYYGIRYQYVPGTWPLEWPPPADRVPANAPRKIFAISVNNLQELATFNDPLFRWLRERQPITKIGYSIFVYDLTRDPEGLRDLAATYDKAGVSVSD